MIIKYIYDPLPNIHSPYKGDGFEPFFQDVTCGYGKYRDHFELKGKTIFNLDINPTTREVILEIDE